MDANFVITLGLFVSVLAVPALIRQLVEGRRPLYPFLSLVLGCGATTWAMMTYPGGFNFSDIPDAVLDVVGRIL